MPSRILLTVLALGAAAACGGASSNGPPSYTLTVQVSGAGSTNPPPGKYRHEAGTQITVTATPRGDAIFGGWSGAASGLQPTVSVTFDGDATLTAAFASPPSAESSLVGWATVDGTVTGGGAATPTIVTTLADLQTAAAGTTAAVIRVSGTITGSVDVGSNKTIVGADAAATIHGHLELSGSSNVILRDLHVVGWNCTDNADCQSGADAISIEGGAHHVLVDHLAVSDGSDGNLDVTHGADHVTVAWTKFFYTGRTGGHQFSNLIGHSDTNATEDGGHLNVTFHHCWWAGGVGERMPRVRFGKVHVFNSLYTAAGDSYAVEAGIEASVLVENSAFFGVKNPIDVSHGDATSNALSSGNVFSGCTGTAVGTGVAFTPPYDYSGSLDPVNLVLAVVQAWAGPR